MIYLDNAATTFPKPDGVIEAMNDLMRNAPGNYNRGYYKDRKDVAYRIYETRSNIAELFDADNSNNVVFTRGITESINCLLKGYLKEGDHVLCSQMEHNAVMRPLNQLSSREAIFDRIPCDENGKLIVSEIERLIRPNTKLIIILHASNVCGVIEPIEEVGFIAKKHGIKFFVDCAQTAGVLPISMRQMNIDAVMFTGHKGLYGPQGVGGFVLTDEMAEVIEPIISGGTGSLSLSEEIPQFMPDKFEAGTLNIPGIIGLNEGVKFIKQTGINNIRNHEIELIDRLINGIKKEPALKEHLSIVGGDDSKDRVGVISVKTHGIDEAQVCDILSNEYNIATRVGMHCAPSAHKVLGTSEGGTLRFSVSFFTTKKDIDDTINALKEIFDIGI